MPPIPDPQQAIGVFDSGLGGLTVVHEIIQGLPNEKVIYFGDTARVPYGTKSAATIIRYSREIARFLLKQKVKILVVACNTASAHALDVLRRELPVEVIGVIEPGARRAARSTKSGKIGIIATSSTIRSEKYADCLKRIDKRIRVISQPCPLFVPLVEEGWFDHAVTYKVAEEYLAPLKKAKVDTVILGCTHYPLIKHVVREVMGPKVALVDSAEQVAIEVEELLIHRRQLRTQLLPAQHTFVVSDEPGNFQKLASRFLGDGIKDVLQHTF